LGLFLLVLLVFFVVGQMLEDTNLSENWKGLFLVLPIFGAIGGVVHVCKD